MPDFTPTFNVNLTESLPFLWDKFLSILGKDAATKDLESWFYELQRIGWNDAATVQYIGMHTPLELSDIYRPTKLQWQTLLLVMENSAGERVNVSLPTHPIDPHEFMNMNVHAAIIAGPGWGKTTFLHYAFLTFIKSKKTLPLLITLRRNGSVKDLARLVDALGSAPKMMRGMLVLLLVDGYDEISLENRKKVSISLNKFKALRLGRLYLSCREFYDLVDLNLPKIKVAPFDREDQISYVKSFTKAYGTQLDADALVAELTGRGLKDLLVLCPINNLTK